MKLFLRYYSPCSDLSNIATSQLRLSMSALHPVDFFVVYHHCTRHQNILLYITIVMAQVIQNVWEDSKGLLLTVIEEIKLDIFRIAFCFGDQGRALYDW